MICKNCRFWRPPPTSYHVKGECWIELPPYVGGYRTREYEGCSLGQPTLMARIEKEER